jgi:hypothetical protein
VLIARPAALSASPPELRAAVEELLRRAGALVEPDEPGAAALPAYRWPERGGRRPPEAA